ncbi:MAG: hypothetical protein KDC16_12755, partial [Saprospiraceae bacterium]|nr:hypothetical protein [Saprospiraceae bacterium]
MNKISLIFILMAAFNIGCYDEYDTVYPSVDLPEKGARAFVESIGDPNFFDIGNPNGLVSLNINTLGESVTAINIFKSYNGGTPILHESIANSGIYDISLTEAIDGLGI